MAGSGGKRAVRARAAGRVQGVGYRASVVERARDAEVLGWVRNEDDGTVLAHLEGPGEGVVEVLTFLHEGPDGAQVDEVEVTDAEVEGHEQFAVRGVAAGRFRVDAHGDGDEPDFYVLVLEVDGAPRAWRVPKGPSLDPAAKRFATVVPADRAPALGAPAAGAVAWDEGDYEQGGRVPWPEAIERGHAVFVLRGERLRGGFALQRTRGEGPRAGWLLVKRRDDHAASAADQR